MKDELTYRQYISASGQLSNLKRILRGDLARSNHHHIVELSYVLLKEEKLMQEIFSKVESVFSSKTRACIFSTGKKYQDGSTEYAFVKKPFTTKSSKEGVVLFEVTSDEETYNLRLQTIIEKENVYEQKGALYGLKNYSDEVIIQPFANSLNDYNSNDKKNES